MSADRPQSSDHDASQGDRRAPVLVSACLVGVHCRYDAMNKRCPRLLEHLRGMTWLPVCPEQLGGLPTPRPPARIVGGDGRDVWRGGARVLTVDGQIDVTDAYTRGALEALAVARQAGARQAHLCARSPSCGFGHLSAGPGVSRPGNGVFAALLIEHGLTIETWEGCSDEA